VYLSALALPSPRPTLGEKRGKEEKGKGKRGKNPRSSISALLESDSATGPTAETEAGEKKKEGEGRRGKEAAIARLPSFFYSTKRTRGRLDDYRPEVKNRKRREGKRKKEKEKDLHYATSQFCFGLVQSFAGTPAISRIFEKASSNQKKTRGEGEKERRERKKKEERTLSPTEAPPHPHFFLGEVARREGEKGRKEEEKRERESFLPSEFIHLGPVVIETAAVGASKEEKREGKERKKKCSGKHFHVPHPSRSGDPAVKDREASGRRREKKKKIEVLLVFRAFPEMSERRRGKKKKESRHPSRRCVRRHDITRSLEDQDSSHTFCRKLEREGGKRRGVPN